MRSLYKSEFFYSFLEILFLRSREKTCFTLVFTSIRISSSDVFIFSYTGAVQSVQAKAAVAFTTLHLTAVPDISFEKRAKFFKNVLFIPVLLLLQYVISLNARGPSKNNVVGSITNYLIGNSIIFNVLFV